AFLAKLNAGKETVAGVHYTVIQSDKDEVVTPYASAFLSGRNVTNLLLQNQCILDQGEHLSMPYDHIADADVLNALDPAHPVTPSRNRGRKALRAPAASLCRRCRRERARRSKLGRLRATGSRLGAERELERGRRSDVGRRRQGTVAPARRPRP